MSRGSRPVSSIRWNRKFLPVQQFNSRNGTQQIHRSLVDCGSQVCDMGKINNNSGSYAYPATGSLLN